MIVHIGKKQTPILIDEEDYNKIFKKGNFINITSHGYVRILRYIGFFNGKTKYSQQYLHSFLMNAPKGMTVDHVDQNRLDNRKQNLRVCTMGENARNRKAISGMYKGVHFVKDIRKWCAGIMINYKSIHIGYFSDIHEAAKAYNEAAKRIHGEYARLNIINNQ